MNVPAPKAQPQITADISALWRCVYENSTWTLLT